MNMPILPAIGASCIVISVVLVAIDWALIWGCQAHKHKSIILWVVLFALTFLVIYAIRTVSIGNITFDGPGSIKVYYIISLVFHITLATVNGILGLIQIILAFKDKLRICRRTGPQTSIIQFFAAVTDIAVRILLYVLYPDGETTSLLRATLGL